MLITEYNEQQRNSYLVRDSKKERSEEIAINLLPYLDNEQIAESTGLSLDEVENIRNNVRS